MFGIGASELVLIVIVALIVVGPKNLPITLRAIGRAIAEFRRASKELRREVGFDEVVEEVTRPLREGMSGLESEVRAVGEEVREATKLGPTVSRNGLTSMWSNEYPEGGADDYGALPETANVYPETAPVYSVAKAEALEQTVSRGSAAAHEES